MPWELYLIENKPVAVCFQVVLEFVIFIIASLLWLTWCTQHLHTLRDTEAKSLAFAIPGYLIGWTCLMMTRLFGSRLKDKFCFSFYVASGVRFMCSAAILFPEFSREWYSVAYGLISLLCFVTSIFHIVTHPNPERRPVRRLIGPDGTIRDDPTTEMMTVKQLENYRDILRDYMEPPETPSVHSAQVIKVSLRGSTDGTSRIGSVPTSGSSPDEWGQTSGTPWMHPTHDHTPIRVRELDPAIASEYRTSLIRQNTQGLHYPLGTDGVIPGTSRRYSAVRVSQITIERESPERDLPESSPAYEVSSGLGERNRTENRGAKSENTKLPTQGSIITRSVNDSRKMQVPVELHPRIQFRPGLSIIEPIQSTPDPSLASQGYRSTRESNQLQRCPHMPMNSREVYTSTEPATANTVETVTRGEAQISGDKIHDTVESKTRWYPKLDPKSTPGPSLKTQELHSTRELNQLQRCPHMPLNHREVYTESTTVHAVETVTAGKSRISEDPTSDTLAYPTVHRPPNITPPTIHRVTCPLHRRQKSRPPPEVRTGIGSPETPVKQQM